MNDDFLRRARRPPSAAFEHQLRDRLRKIELSEVPQRRRSWKVLTIAFLFGGTALATATYLTVTHTQWGASLTTRLGPATTDTASPEANPNAAPEPARWSMDAKNRTRAPSSPPTSSTSPENTTVTAGEGNKQRPAPSTGDKTENTSNTSPGWQTSTPARKVRVVISPDILAFAKETSPASRHASSASYEIDSDDKALPALCSRDFREQPDMVVTSRRARQRDFDLCRRTDDEVLGTTIGHIATVVTRAKTGTLLPISTRTLRLALLKQVPSPDNSSLLVDNPYTHWNQIDPGLDNSRIKVLGPARTSPEFMVFATTLLEPGCDHFSSEDKAMCRTLREDGLYEEARFDNTFIGQRLWSDPNVVAIMDYRFYSANREDLLGSLLTGTPPTQASIVDGSYVGVRTLRVFVNRMEYRTNPRVSVFINEYLRQPTELFRKVMIPPDGDLEARRMYGSAPKLTEVKLD